VRVLYVDDNAPNRTVVRCMLDAAGVDMAEAEAAEAGLAMIDTDFFDVVLMDLRMPGMDGFTAIRHLRARIDDKARLPVVVLTADNAHDIRAQALAVGADDLLLKPVQMDALFDVIARVMTAGGRDEAILA
jgi:two-component system, OmpR family, response regulator QseB